MRIIFTYIALIAFLGQACAAEKQKPLNITITNIENETYDIQPIKENKFAKMKNVTVNNIILKDLNAPADPEEFEIYKYKKIKDEKLNKKNTLIETRRKIRMAKSARRKSLEDKPFSQNDLNRQDERDQKAIKSINSDISKIRRSIKDLDLTIDYLEHPEKYE